MGGGEKVSVSGDGSVEIHDRKTRGTLSKAQGDYHLVQAGGPVVMLARDVDGERPSVLMAGELGSRTAAIEIVSLIAQSTWRGELTLQEPGARRGLIFDQGVLQVTHSNAPGERLGEIMLAFGVLSQTQLEQCLADRSGKRFGEVAIALGFVTQEGVFDQLVRQARRVFEAAVLMEQGTYAFVVHDAGTAIDAPITVHLPVQGLLLDSMQRVDEMAVFRKRIPDGEVRPLSRAGVERVTLPENLLPVAALSDGKRTILDIAQQLSLDEFETTKAVAQLLQIGYLDLQVPEVRDDAPRQLIEGFSEALVEISQAVAAETTGDARGWSLREAVTGGPLLDFFSDGMRPDGGLDADALLASVERLGMEDPLATLRQALHQLMSFAMFAAGPQLSRQNEKLLRTSLQDRERRLRQL